MASNKLHQGGGEKDMGGGPRQGVQFHALYEISKILAGATDPGRAVLEVFNTLRDRLLISKALLGIRNQESAQVEIVAALGFPSKPKRDPYYRRATAIVDEVTKSGYPQVISDVEKNNGRPDPIAQDTDKSCAFCVPIRVRGRTTGALMIEHDVRLKLGSFEDEVNFLRIIAALLGQSFELQYRLGGFSRANKSADAELSNDVHRLIGSSQAIREVIHKIERIGPGGATVLIRGESGTGKELVASALHRISPRKNDDLVIVVCAALPENLLETALFGHERGAFTGATERKTGYLEKANGGTLFLDEIGDMFLSTQIKLLRFLQERTFERVGGTQPISVDVRVIAATNRDLETAVQAGRFRQDLYYRLNVVPVVLPPLRERKEDIPLLVEHFVKSLRNDYDKEIVFSGDALRKLQDYEWPGNVRELENFVERLMVLAPDRLITAKDITLPKNRLRPPSPEPATTPMVAEAPARLTLRDIERDQVVRAMEEAGGIQAQAAQALGITPRQLAYRIKKYDISRAQVSYK